MTEDAIDELAARAAKKAGEWWAARLFPAYKDKAEAFAAAVERYTYQALTGQTKWGWDGTMAAGDGKPITGIYVESDYDPKGPLLKAVTETVEPNCKGFMFSSKGILPYKTELFVTRERLRPKEGYGNWTEEIRLA